MQLRGREVRRLDVREVETAARMRLSARRRTGRRTRCRPAGGEVLLVQDLLLLEHQFDQEQGTDAEYGGMDPGHVADRLEDREARMIVDLHPFIIGGVGKAEHLAHVRARHRA